MKIFGSNNRRRILCICFVIVAPATLFCGCVGLRQQQLSADMRRQHEMDSLRADVLRIQQQVEDMSQGRQSLYSGLEQVESTTARQQQSLQQQIDEINKRLSVIEGSSARMRTEIVDDISKRIDKIMRSAAPAAPVRTQEGYEHTVQAGQTLSEIAAAYNVSVEAIVRANNMNNPNSIRVGQTLFIPE